MAGLLLVGQLKSKGAELLLELCTLLRDEKHDLLCDGLIDNLLPCPAPSRLQREQPAALS